MARFLAIFSALLLPLTAAENAPRSVHDALFASYIPIEELKERAELVAMFTRARDQIWVNAGNAPAFQELLAPLADLRRFGNTCGIQDLIANAGVTGFDQLTPAMRTRTLYLLH